MSLYSFLILTCLIIAGCTRQSVYGIQPDEVRVVSVTYASSPRNVGLLVTVRGQVTDVCKEEGCWLVITDDTSSLKVAFRNKSVHVPTDLSGVVLVQGTISHDRDAEQWPLVLIADGLRIE